MSEENKLSDEDLARVRSVTNSGYNSTERQPFRPVSYTHLTLPTNREV